MRMGLGRTTAAMFGALVSLAIILFPVYAIIVASFEKSDALYSNTYHWLPYHPTIENYSSVLRTQSTHLLSSLILGLGTAALSLALAVPAAHFLARYRFRVTIVVMGVLLVAQIVPSIVIANSLFVVYYSIHLLNSYPGLILADATYSLPFAILVLRAFMLGLPEDVLQAARVDGASEWQTFMQIVLPMSRSAIVTVSLFGFLNGWGDFIFALTLLQGGGAIAPLTLSIYNYIGEFNTNLGAAMAAAVFAVLPAAVMLIAAQRYIAAGLTAGAIRG